MSKQRIKTRLKSPEMRKMWIDPVICPVSDGLILAPIGKRFFHVRKLFQSLIVRCEKCTWKMIFCLEKSEIQRKSNIYHLFFVLLWKCILKRQVYTAEHQCISHSETLTIKAPITLINEQVW